MLYLARVQHNPMAGDKKLQLLACQKSAAVWVFAKTEIIPLAVESWLGEGAIVLAELNEQRQVIELQEATDWLLNLVEQYLGDSAITPEFVAAEQVRVEQWRRELTAQSQELTRIRLEVETRREQLQLLEAALKQEQEKLKQKTQELSAN
ncbi:MAG: hypothetical protein HC890_01800 [Chloroflexaceae bacterium]|nr:hypothetical protein [Chloroflexaceae bacterium]